MALIINEIFYSIQGESTFAGQACVFVRLTGCNLRCSYCDTHYAYSEGSPMAVEQVVKKVAVFGCKLVEITGGEPLLQADTGQLVDLLLEKGFEVLMETNGSLDIRKIDQACKKIIDIKCPGSGEADQFDVANLQHISSSDQIKFVISDRQDYLYAKKMLVRIPARVLPDSILLSPVWGKVTGRELAAWILDDGLQVRLQLQLHKIIWPDIDRGV